MMGTEAVGLAEVLALYPVPCPGCALPRLCPAPAVPLGYEVFVFLPGHTVGKGVINLRVNLRRLS